MKTIPTESDCCYSHNNDLVLTHDSDLIKNQHPEISRRLITKGNPVLQLSGPITSFLSSFLCRSVFRREQCTSHCTWRAQSRKVTSCLKYIKRRGSSFIKDCRMLHYISCWNPRGEEQISGKPAASRKNHCPDIDRSHLSLLLSLRVACPSGICSSKLFKRYFLCIVRSSTVCSCYALEYYSSMVFLYFFHVILVL